MFNGVYKNKKVVVTGHTGFKGTWLVTWLIKLGANVVGISNKIPSSPSMFEELDLLNSDKDYRVDIRDLKKLTEILEKEKPDFLFHLAAQPIVSISYSDPIETISSNVMGTVNVLESLRNLNINCTTIMITSDKVYDNIEQVWGYKEDDKIGGKDIYSGSKGAAELMIKSYVNSFFNSQNSNVKIAIGRAGNVIGGGDWAKDRIIVDSMIAWSQGEKVEIRNPEATRPWQHVLEPLSGYLNLGLKLYESKLTNGEAFNFGPKAEQNHTVKKLLDDLSSYWSFNSVDEAIKEVINFNFTESKLLKLNCDKALFYLEWQANLEYEDTIKFTSEWYFNYYNNTEDIKDLTNRQIDQYEQLAKKNKIKWTE